jgi:hypothetical protein
MLEGKFASDLGSAGTLTGHEGLKLVDSHRLREVGFIFSKTSN